MSSFKPMLASPADLDKLIYPLFASPKLDGIRAAVVNGELLSRKLKPIPNRHISEVMGWPRFNGIDGELIVGDPRASDVYRTTVSGVMSQDGEPDFTFYAFDVYDSPKQFRHRLQDVAELAVGRSVIRVHEHVEVGNPDDLLAYEAKCIAEGYEGLILRSVSGPYKFGRSTTKEQYMLKLKRFEDSEAEIVGVVEEMHNGNAAETDELGRTKRSSAKAGKTGKGSMGTLVVRDIYSGVEFEIGTGFTAADRQHFWNVREKLGVSDVVKYKFFPVGVKDKPRHPVYLGMRDAIDIS